MAYQHVLNDPCLAVATKPHRMCPQLLGMGYK